MSTAGTAAMSTAATATGPGGEGPMAVVRHNIVTHAPSRQKFALGVNRLKQDFSGGVTTSTMGFGGDPIPVSAYDQFVLWHFVDMTTETPPRNPTGRNAAHRGSIFLPWHRFMLLLFEAHLQRVLRDPDFGLPYWEWSADGALPIPEQPKARLWKECIGGSGMPVTTGPFAFDPNPRRKSFRVFFVHDPPTGRLQVVRRGRGLNRQLGEAAVIRDLPKPEQVRQALVTETTYDSPEWTAHSPGFRNRLEGWPLPTEHGLRAGLHNRVHVWVGGDMGPGTSPNDPVFYLNHCEVDRIWEAWMLRNGRRYLPDDTSPRAPEGHRLNDTIRSLVTTVTKRPSDLLDVSTIYTYDVLPSAP
jgi:tyrosinase